MSATHLPRFHKILTNTTLTAEPKTRKTKWMKVVKVATFCIFYIASLYVIERVGMCYLLKLNSGYFSSHFGVKSFTNTNLIWCDYFDLRLIYRYF